MAATKTTKRAKKTDSGSQKDQIAKLDPNEKLDISTIETWLWDAACVIRGATDAPKFKDYILPLVFYKRLSDVFDDEFEQKVQEFGDEDLAREIIAADHASALKEGRKPIVRFYIPDPYRWYKVRNHAADGSLGEFLTTIMRGDAQKGEVGIAGLNPDLQGVLDIKDFNETQSGQRILEDDRLSDLIEVISRHRLGLKNAEPDVFGQAYEYLLRKFAEGQGQSAGEFLTPPEVGWLMAEIIDPKPYSTVYD
ncbi:MAG: type I restriction-modification system subunit M N-terminal domain-containing protein, partial [Pseudanabaena sp.]